ncbi:DNA primase small subunit PriS [Halocatena pleomorpha]|uniref:DNA primase small subunit PriS n=1 Tax=Halocatena pleomorpha TaxID=1785090 RepID=A0A3P3R2Z6_9EURY|nr:DNA primase small subunit PriS [Halocatena pleomorpha]RRJ27826.1 DNA primase small subunit PriS [Halocatena pleomorpha]
MNERTREYLRGRFGDHYRRSDIALPPAASAREWGFIPFTAGPGTTMIRHKSLLDLGDLSAFLVDTCPRHVYFSAGQYDDPGTRPMEDKEWRGSDLVFDLDGDHLPNVDPEADTYAEMLSACKDALLRLLGFLHDDFGFDSEQLSVVFSGGRGYHVHVRTESVRTLGRDARREIVEYVLGAGIDDIDRLTRTETVAGMGRSTPAEKKTLKTDGGWGRRVHDRLVALTESVQTAEKAGAIEQLRAFDGIGEKGAAKLYETMTERPAEIIAGNLDAAGRYTPKLAQQLFEQAVAEDSVPIDEPVTTDVNRLIRLPGSLHGGSGLLVTPLDHEEIEAFDPFEDAVPSTFEDAEIRIETEQAVELGRIGEERDKIPAGNHTVQESVGVFLMARGRAEKAPE